MRSFILFVAVIFSTISSAFSQNFEWAQLIGDNLTQFFRVMDVDSVGNIVLAGGGHYVNDDTIVSGSYDCYIAKFNSDGDLQWIKIFDYGFNLERIKIDLNGDIYASGAIGGTVDFDPGAGTHNVTPTQMAQYLLKLDTDGNFKWVKTIEYNNDSSESIELSILEVDRSNNLWIAGYYKGDSLDFDMGTGTHFFGPTTYWNSFILKLDTSGNTVWTANIDSSTTVSLTIDPSGNSILSGYTYGKGDYDPGPSIYNFSTPGIYFVRFLSDGSFDWVRGGIQTNPVDYYNPMASDNLGDVYSIGIFSGTVDFDPGSGVHSLTAAGTIDYYILKLSKFGDFLWAHNIGPKDLNHYSATITIDGYQNILVCGQFKQTVDFDFGAGVDSRTCVGSADIFVAKYSPYGQLIWVETFGGNTNTSLSQMRIDHNGGITLGGSFRGAAMDCDPDIGDSILTPNSFSTSDIFLIKWIDSTSIIGIETFNEVDSFIVYPNPFNDHISISGIDEPTQTILFNSLGEQIGNWKINSDNPTIPIYGLKSGIYFLRLQNKTSLITKKIIKS